MEFKGSKTEQNLIKAYAGESMATNRYLYFAKRAEKEGLKVIANVFEYISKNERQHAKLWFDYIEGLNDTLENLRKAMAGEHYEFATMYKEFAETAREEGFDDIAERFEQVGDIEKTHEDKYAEYLYALEKGQLFNDPTCTAYECTNCGYTTLSAAPDVCPVCKHSRGYFERKN